MAQRKPQIMGYGSVRRSGGGRPRAPSAPVKGMCRALKQAFRCHRAARELGCLMDIQKYLNTAKCHSGEVPTEPYGKRTRKARKAYIANFVLAWNVSPTTGNSCIGT
jgi:hypothetical protein